MESFRPGSNFRAWVFRIGHNNFVNQKRADRRTKHPLPEDAAGAGVGRAEDAAENREALEVVSKAVAELPSDFRAALLLRVEEGLSFREVAKVLGTTEETARWRVFKARQKLMKVLSPELLPPASFLPFQGFLPWRPGVFNLGNLSPSHQPPERAPPFGPSQAGRQLKVGFRNDKPCLERGINETCPRPHRKYALAQCRIGFQPVSPEPWDEPSRIRSFAMSMADNLSIKRTTLSREGMKGSSCGPGDRLEAYPTFFPSVER